MQIYHGKTRWICFKLYKKCSWALTSPYDEVMAVHSGAILRISVRSHNQGLQISHLSLNSNYHTGFVEWDGYGAKLPTKDIVRGQEINLVQQEEQDIHSF